MCRHPQSHERQQHEGSLFALWSFLFLSGGEDACGPSDFCFAFLPKPDSPVFRCSMGGTTFQKAFAPSFKLWPLMELELRCRFLCSSRSMIFSAADSCSARGVPWR